MQTIASILKQNFTDSQPNTSDASVSVAQIHTYLKEKFKFQMSENNDDEQDLADRLLECIIYLLKRNEKLFIRVMENEPAESSSENNRYKLNSVYIHRKLIDNKKIEVNSITEKRSQIAEFKEENGIEQDSVQPTIEQSVADNDGSSPNKKIKSSDSTDVNTPNGDLAQPPKKSK